jgi:Cu(I)/Ag(I) efflux system membrane fusion protein
MNPIRLIGSIAAAALLLGAGFWLGRNVPGHDATSRVATAPEPAASADSRKVLYWHDPMVPGQRFDKPGKSPFMDMPLVPVYADGDAPGGVQVSPSVQQSLGIRTATVRRATMSSSFDAVGTVQFDERRSVAVQTRVAGYVERLAVRAPMERVRKGQTLATLFAPDWLAPQNELLALKSAGVAADLVAAARDRLRALSIPEELVQRSEQSGTAQARFALASPADGVVAELAVREGVAVNPGMTLFRIAGLETVWAVAEVPEVQAVRLARGQKVKASLKADPSQAFEGELKEILPEVSSVTRTLKARFEVDNRAGKLMPGMLLRLAVAGPQVARLVVPSEAIIRTGKRAVAILRSADGRFEPREVALGADFGDDVEIVSGLAAGDQVVASGQFLIDSEARLRSVLGNIASAAPPAPQASAQLAQAAPAAPVHEGEGRVERVSAETLTISHGPIATLKWPAMTMGFAKPRANAFPDIKPGDRVRFRFREGGASGYELVEVTKLSAGAAK